MLKVVYNKGFQKYTRDVGAENEMLSKAQHGVTKIPDARKGKTANKLINITMNEKQRENAKDGEIWRKKCRETWRGEVKRGRQTGIRLRREPKKRRTRARGERDDESRIVR
jgi:hypothetical protein